MIKEPSLLENQLLIPQNFLLNHIPFDRRFQYQLLSEKYIDQVIDVFTIAFCRSEPMTAYLKMDEKKYRIFARAVTEKAYADKLSVIALDKDKVIALALVEDIAVPGPIPDFDPKFEYILALLDRLGVNFFPGKTFFPESIAHLFITAVHPDYRGKSLSKQVNYRAMDLAAQNNFDFVYCELTHYFNEVGTIKPLKNNKKLIGHCVYDQFTYKGMRPFEHLKGGANSYLWSIRKTDQLVYKQNGTLHTIKV